MPARKALAQWRIVPDTIIIVLGELPRRTGEQGNDETQQAVRAGFQQQGRQDHAACGGGLRMGVAQPAMQRHDLDAAERLGRVPPGVPAGQVEVSNRDSSRLEPLLVGGDPDGHVWSGSGCRLTSERSGDPYGFTPSASADSAQTGVRMDGPCAFCRIAFSTSPCAELVEASAIVPSESDNQSREPKKEAARVFGPERPVFYGFAPGISRRAARPGCLARIYTVKDALQADSWLLPHIVTHIDIYGGRSRVLQAKVVLLHLGGH